MDHIDWWVVHSEKYSVSDDWVTKKEYHDHSGTLVTNSKYDDKHNLLKKTKFFLWGSSSTQVYEQDNKYNHFDNITEEYSIDYDSGEFLKEAFNHYYWHTEKKNPQVYSPLVYKDNEWNMGFWSEIGDTLYISCVIKLIVDTTFYRTMENGEERKVLQLRCFENSDLKTTWIEGIGDLGGGLALNASSCYVGWDKSLVCFHLSSRWRISL